MSVVAKTQRTIIRELTLADSQFIHELMNSDDWLHFIGDRQLYTLQDTQKYLETNFIPAYSEIGFGYYLACTHSGNPLGIAGFLKKAYLDNKDFGFGFSADYHGQGYGFEVSESLLNYAKQRLKFTIVDAVTMPSNAASRALLEKLGFVQIGQLNDPSDDELLYLYRKSLSYDRT